jgi:hypothetical protein
MCPLSSGATNPQTSVKSGRQGPPADAGQMAAKRLRMRRQSPREDTSSESQNAALPPQSCRAYLSGWLTGTPDTVNRKIARVIIIMYRQLRFFAGGHRLVPAHRVKVFLKRMSDFFTFKRKQAEPACEMSVFFISQDIVI